ncbi:hypothetical protein D6T63_16625 [Arthrobacter cheniae]|uniref:DUF7793 domain-containing protein n=1 Tax=Arthrobacter cheniae TaxID=1258888 RepID=A0A3A5LXP6_9MICC|nr:hypothetical protein [Arthrobacter cheniae]RJT76224.1 hypothetical protein D6T63_16625 [Arthrobacter cheniae]
MSTVYSSAGLLPVATRFRLQVLDDGILVLQWDRSLEVTVADAVELIRHKELLAPGRCSPILVELNGMVTMARHAFVLMAESLDVSAAAIVGSCPVEKILVTHFEAVHRPPYPVAYFESRGQALESLHERTLLTR